MNVRKLLPASAIALALGLGATGQAYAYAYAYGDLHVSELSVTVLPTGSTALTDFGTCVQAGCAAFTFPGNVNATSASASLDGTGTATNGNLDALVALGTGSVFPDATTPANNSWTLEGASNSHEYAWGDAQIISEQSLGNPAVNGDGTPNFASKIEVRQIAEGNVIDPSLGSSSGGTSSTTEFDVVVGAGGARIRFDFNAALDMLAEITAPNTGVQANATSRVTFTLIDADTEDQIFNWLVGSAVGGIGSALLSQAFDLSTQVSTNTLDSIAFSDSGVFAMVTNNIAAGAYKLIASARIEENVQADVVPAPGSLALLALGLIGAAGRARMTKRA